MTIFIVLIALAIVLRVLGRALDLIADAIQELDAPDGASVPVLQIRIQIRRDPGA